MGWAGLGWAGLGWGGGGVGWLSQKDHNEEAPWAHVCCVGQVLVHIPPWRGHESRFQSLRGERLRWSILFQA